MGAVVSFFERLFGATPDPCNTTNEEIQKHHETERQSRTEEQVGTDLADIKMRVTKLEEEALKNSEARKREADAHKRQEAKRAAQQAGRDVKPSKQKGEKLETREKEAMEKETKAKRVTGNLSQVVLGVGECQEEIIASSHQQEAETWIVADTHSQPVEQARGCLEIVSFCREGHEGKIEPEVWPTEKEFQLAKKRIEYNPEKIHFAVCGSSGSGKSSLVNAFRGLKNNNSEAARTGIVETTKEITRYPDPQQKMPYKRLVWFDCPGAGTLKVPGWQYFNQQGLFIFDVIVLVYDTRFTEIDVSIIQNCERFKIPLFIVRSKADAHIRNIMKDLGYDENDDDAEDSYEEYQEEARRSLIDNTKHDLKVNLEEAGLAMHDIFIVSDSAIYSLITMKPKKKKKTTPPMIDEARLIESVLKAAYQRRYTTQAPVQSSWDIISRGRNMITAPLPSTFKQVVAHQLDQAGRFAEDMLIGYQWTDEEYDESGHESISHTPIASSSSPNAHQLSEEESYLVVGPPALMPNITKIYQLIPGHIWPNMVKKGWGRPRGR